MPPWQPAAGIQTGCPGAITTPQPVPEWLQPSHTQGRERRARGLSEILLRQQPWPLDVLVPVQDAVQLSLSTNMEKSLEKPPGTSAPVSKANCTSPYIYFFISYWFLY